MRLLEAKGSQLISDKHVVDIAFSRWATGEKRQALALLKAQGTELTPIHEAATLGDMDIVAAELKNIKHKDPHQGRSALHFASANNQKM